MLERGSAVSRVPERLDELYAIDRGAGANRPGLSAAEEEAHRLVASWFEEAGMAVERDAAGNLYGRLVGEEPALPEVWTGSHLDSVPEGGRFDGALGVVGGLEAVVRAGRCRRTLCVVAFRDEEGWRFGRGCFGSRALVGALEPGELETCDAEGISIREALGAEPPAAGWLERAPAAFVELHVEQGPRLAAAGSPLAVVDSIAGLARLEVVFEGEPGHAGTTPMEGRRDALVEAARFVERVRAAAVARPGSVATVGRIAVEPNAANVIPARVELIVDARAPVEAQLADLLLELEDAAQVEPRVLRRTVPAPMDAGLQAVLREAAAEVVAGEVPVFSSGAGHDAGALALAGVPSVMLFVRSLAGGVSHSPDEHSSPEDVAAGVEALALALRRLASA
jgi:hydantoinase/carbamoylase family amidase